MRVPSAHALHGDRPAALGPAGDIDVVDQPVHDEAAVQPGEVAVVGDLVSQLALARRLGLEAHGPMHAVGAQQDQVANRAIVQSLDDLLTGPVVSPHQTACDLKVLRFRCLPRSQDSANPGSIHAK